MLHYQKKKSLPRRLEKPKTGKLTKKEMKELASQNQKLSGGKAESSSQVDQKEVVKLTKSPQIGQGIPNNKLIKSYKRSSNANNNKNAYVP